MHNSKNYLASDLPFRKSQIIPSRNLHAFYTYFHWVLVISKNQKPIILIKTFIVWSENIKAAWFFFVWTMVLNLFKKKKLNTLSVNFYFCLFSRENCDLQNNKWFTVCRTLFVSKLVMTLFGVLAQSSRDCSLITESIVSNDEKYPFKILYYEPNKYLSFKSLSLKFHYFFFRIQDDVASAVLYERPLMFNATLPQNYQSWPGPVACNLETRRGSFGDAEVNPITGQPRNFYGSLHLVGNWLIVLEICNVIHSFLVKMHWCIHLFFWLKNLCCSSVFISEKHGQFFMFSDCCLANSHHLFKILLR